MRQTIFISSVQSEFEAERSMIAEYIRTDAMFARYFEPFLFEELPAQDVSAQKAYLDAASTADIYIVLVGERYGYEDTEGVSPTEREYDIATENSAYRLAFIKDVEKRIDASVGERTQSAQADIRYELPVQAVTEAIVNAVIHRDYTSTGSVQVMLFKDRLEVWNPGRLPYGITLAKLSSEHNSIPVNPLLARPVYLAGYIEQLGTGTTDLVNRCIEYGLREPEFYQNENFRTIIWRKTSNHDTNHDTNHDSNHDEVLSNNKSNENKIVYDEEINTLSNQVRRVVLALGNARLTREELLDKMELRNRGNLRERYINPAVEAGYVKLRFPDSLQRKDQAYYLTRKGIKLLNKLKKLGNN